MPTNVKSSTMVYPFSLGSIVPGANFAGASVAVTVNKLPVMEDGTTPDKMWNSVWIQASPANSDNIYICTSSAAPDLVNYTNIVGILLAGQWWPRVRPWGNPYNLSTIFVGAANAVDFAIVSIDAA